MNTSNRYYILAGLGALAVLAIIVSIIFIVPALGERAARAHVEEFGTKLQNVSLLDPNASSTMAQAYGPYLTTELLAAWQADPESAAGRLTSSPWPARIEIDSVDPQGSGYTMSGRVIQATSEGDAGETPVVVLVVKDDGEWKIAVYQERAED